MNRHQTGSVTGWIEGLKSNNPDAQRQIWKRFVERLVSYANRKLNGVTCGMVDANDIANMAFQNFFEKSPEEFASLVDRNDLWKILCMLAERRAIDALRKNSALKNGSNQVVYESGLGLSDSDKQRTFDQFPGNQVPPDFQLILSEEVEQRLDSLRTDLQRRIAIEKMQGLTNHEIAQKLSISLRSVERKLNMIRNAFQSKMN